MVVECLAGGAVPLIKCLSTVCHRHYQLKANILPANASMYLQLLELSMWKSGYYAHWYSLAAPALSCRDGTGCREGEFTDEQEQCLLKSHSIGESVLDY